MTPGKRMTMRKPHYFGLALTALAAALAGVAISEQLYGVGAAYWSGSLSEDTTGSCVLNVTDAGAGSCMLFPAGRSGSTVTVVTANGAGRCGFALTSSPTMSGMSWLTSAKGAGGGDIYRLQAAGARWDHRPDRAMLIGRPGGTASAAGGPGGICDASVTIGGDVLYAPCSTVVGPGYSACTTYGGTCRTTDCVGSNRTGCITREMHEGVGAFLLCESDSGTVTFSVTKEVPVRR